MSDRHEIDSAQATCRYRPAVAQRLGGDPSVSRAAGQPGRFPQRVGRLVTVGRDRVDEPAAQFEQGGRPQPLVAASGRQAYRVTQVFQADGHGARTQRRLAGVDSGQGVRVRRRRPVATRPGDQVGDPQLPADPGAKVPQLGQRGRVIARGDQSG
jgi:hypothetical protein